MRVRKGKKRSKQIQRDEGARVDLLGHLDFSMSEMKGLEDYEQRNNMI